MTTNTSAIYAVNSYVWALLKNELGWTKVNVPNKGALVPVIPANQEPEFTQTGKPFIVYGTASEWPGPMWWLQNEQAAYTIYSDSVGVINEAVRHLNEAFIRMDEAARDLNAYLHGPNGLGEWYDDNYSAGNVFDGIHFKTVEVVSSQGAGALEEEGGRQSGLVVIRYKYVTQPDIDFVPPVPT